MNKNKRRAVLSAVTGASLLPSSWSKPIITTLVMPAHAQTTSTTSPSTTSPSTTPPAPCGSLTIPGIGPLTCSPIISGEQTYYKVDDTSGCPRLLASGTGTPLIGVVVTVRTDPRRAFINVRINGLSTGGHEVDCLDKLLANVPNSKSVNFTSTSGATWNASYTVTGDVTVGVTVSDIILTPAP